LQTFDRLRTSVAVKSYGDVAGNIDGDVVFGRRQRVVVPIQGIVPERSISSAIPGNRGENTALFKKFGEASPTLSSERTSRSTAESIRLMSMNSPGQTEGRHN